MMKMKNCISGFTLLELVITMVLSAILAIVVSVFIARPITAYTSVTRRAELVDAADLALRRMARDIQQAVPNSLRVKTDSVNAQRVALEMLNTVEGMRYRGTQLTAANTQGILLDFAQPITQFNVMGLFQYALSNSTCTANNCRVVIYNTGANTGGAIPSDNPSPGANVYSTVAAPSCAGCLPPPGSVTITPVATTVTLSNPVGNIEGLVTLGTATQFAFPSPRQRVAFVDTPITYLCDASINQITRYWNYTINSVQPTNSTVAPLNAAQSAQLTKDVTACSFTYSPGTPQRNGVITMSITLSKGGETITLMRQVSVDNIP